MPRPQSSAPGGLCPKIRKGGVPFGFPSRPKKGTEPPKSHGWSNGPKKKTSGGAASDWQLAISLASSRRGAVQDVFDCLFVCLSVCLFVCLFVLRVDFR